MNKEEISPLASDATKIDGDNANKVKSSTSLIELLARLLVEDDLKKENVRGDFESSEK